MTTEEFSQEFDILLNSYSNIGSFSPPSPIDLDEYEKSVFLTTAQDAVVKQLYTGSITGKGFEYNEEVRQYLSSIVKEEILLPTIEPSSNEESLVFNDNLYTFALPENIWYIVYIKGLTEKPTICGNKDISIVPIRHDEWESTKNNPFRKPNKRKAVYLNRGGNIEVVSEYKINKVLVRYIRKPSPIILTNFDTTLTIDGISNQTECELPTSLHRTILDNAVRLALTRFQTNQNEK